MVIIDQCDNPHRFTLVVGDGLLDKSSAHQTAHSLASVWVSMQLAVLIESLQELAADRHAESDEWIFHRANSLPVGTGSQVGQSLVIGISRPRRGETRRAAR